MGGQTSSETGKTSEETDTEIDGVREKRKEQGFFLNFDYEGQDIWFKEVFDLLQEKKYEEFEKIAAAKPNLINSITYENHFQPTLLIHALEYHKDDSIVEYLIKHKDCDITVPDQVGNTPIYLAAQNGNLDVVKWLLEKDSSILNKTHACRTPLHIAAGYGHKEMVEYFLQQDHIDVDIKNYHGKTPDRVKGVNKDIVKLIADHRKKVAGSN